MATKRDCLSDDALEQMAAPPRKDWTPAQWLSFQEGWCNQRLGYPLAAGTKHLDHFEVGYAEAAHFDGTADREARQVDYQ